MLELEESNDKPILKILKSLINCWEEKNAFNFQTFFTEDGSIIDLDGTYVSGNKNIFNYLVNLFKKNKTDKIVYNVKEIKIFPNNTSLLIAEVGMYRSNCLEVDPSLNSILCITLFYNTGKWKIENLQFTPALLMNQPDAKKNMTIELNKKLKTILLEKSNPH